MRRSVREALVGFSLLAAVGSGLGLWLWLKGISIARGNWIIQASFEDAAGLANRSPVSYRGVLVGRVKNIQVSDREVLADLEITNPRLRLARPVLARVGAASLLGGDAVVSLVATGQSLPPGGAGPHDKACDNRLMVCDRGRIKGLQAPNLETVTATVQKLLDQADDDQIVQRIVESTKSFSRTAKEAEKLSTQGQAFVGDAQSLVRNLNTVVGKTDPIVRNLNAASQDARQASQSVKKLATRLDNPRTTADLEATLANARQLTDRWAAVGGDVRKLTDDPRFMDGLRSVSAGLGRFFDDLYPANAEAGSRSRSGAGRPARAAAPRSAPAVQEAVTPTGVRYETPEALMAPRSKAPATPVPAYGYGTPAAP
jgi:phospholipid/cholesterol/gamma-HCH transport system substrate-binding protein